MTKNDSLKMLGLLVLGGLLMAALYFDVFTPKFWQETWPKILAWMQEYRTRLLVGGICGLILLVSVITGTVLLRRAKWHAIQQRVAAGPTCLLLPRSDWRPISPDKVNLWARLADALPHDEHISFEIVGSDTEVCFAIHGSEEGVRAALTQVKAEWPGVQRRPVQPDLAAVPEGWSIFWVEVPSAPGRRVHWKNVPSGPSCK